MISTAQSPVAKPAQNPISREDATMPIGVSPKPIPSERYEEISKKMLTAQSAQIQAMQIQAEAEKAIKAAETAMKAYSELKAALQKEFGAEGCDLSLEKTWIGCPDKKVK